MWVLKTINKISQISTLNMKHTFINNLNFNCKSSIKITFLRLEKKAFQIETIEVDNNYYYKKVTILYSKRVFKRWRRNND